MANITGGLRARLIRESLYEMLNDSLTYLGWFNAGRPHSPILLESQAVNRDVQITVNTAALSDDYLTDFDVELGSLLAEHRWTMYFDFFAENDALGLHFVGDVRAILQGRMQSIGRDDPSFVVYDYRQATPTVIATCQIENVTQDRAHGFLKPWLEHWYALQFTVVDFYGDEVN